MVRSSAVVMSRVPSGVNASRTIGPSWANLARTIGLIRGPSRETKSQTRIVLSAPPATMVRPSGLKAQQYSSLSGWGSVSIRIPSPTRQTLQVSSALALTRKRPSGLKATS